MAILFDTLLTQGVRSGQIPARTQQARNWFRDAAQSINSVNEKRLMNADKARMTTKLDIGSMYLFHYDPKHKDTLPYYDTLPIIFPFESVSGGFLGLNLHYLPLQVRANLMDALYETVNNGKYNEQTRLKINYSILKNASGSKYIKPCIKHYLNNHVKSKFMYVYPSEWDIAAWLPLARFEKASEDTIFADSKKLIGITK